MSSQHDVLEVDNRDTSADEKKKDEKVWGTFLTRFSGTVKVMRIKWIKSQKVQEVLLSEEELLKDKKTIFLRNLIAGGVNWFAHDWLMQQGSTMWSWPIISDSFLKCVNETFVKREMWCSQKVSNTYELKRKVKIAPYWKSGAQFLLWTLTRKLCPK